MQKIDITLHNYFSLGLEFIFKFNLANNAYDRLKVEYEMILGCVT